MNNTPAAAVELDPLDRIERSVEIDASAERVFELVSRPGWWINEGTIDPEPDLRREGEFTVVTHPKYGEFRLRTEASEPPSYVAFRWHHRLPDDGITRTTLVEFRIQPLDGQGVRLTVVESGFSQLQKPREEWLTDRSNNDVGWTTELAAARTFLEAPTSPESR